jgi:plasmid stabilization system protein ParE
MRIRYTPRAFADREEIFAYIEKLSPGGARAVKSDIVKAIRRLEHFPHRHRRPTNPASIN